MSILIKNMEMPTSCAKCKLFGEYGCPFIGAVGYALTRGERNEDCPLVPIQPHGRLIDADAFLALINDSTILSEFLKCIINPLIRGEPTIIPAEEGECALARLREEVIDED